MARIFQDRQGAGKELASRLEMYTKAPDVLLFALPRGGVVVGGEIADALKLPLDVIVTRKISSPSNEEYAIGALAETGETVWNEAERILADERAINKIVAQENKEAARRIHAYRQDRPLPDMTGKTVVIIDDGVATGLTIRAAIAVARHQHALKIVLAIPHGAKESVDLLRREVDEVVALEEPAMYSAVGQYYQDFPQTSDAEVVEIMKRYGSQ